MKKRVLAGLLWFYVTWYAWNYVAAFTGLTVLAGPVLGAVSGWFVAADPLGKIWTRTRTRPVAASSTTAADPA
jgi:hypothetical protein